MAMSLNQDNQHNPIRYITRFCCHDIDLLLFTVAMAVNRYNVMENFVDLKLMNVLFYFILIFFFK